MLSLPSARKRKRYKLRLINFPPRVGASTHRINSATTTQTTTAAVYWQKSVGGKVGWAKKRKRKGKCLQFSFLLIALWYSHTCVNLSESGQIREKSKSTMENVNPYCIGAGKRFLLFYHPFCHPKNCIEIINLFKLTCVYVRSEFDTRECVKLKLLLKWLNLN